MTEMTVMIFDNDSNDDDDDARTSDPAEPGSRSQAVVVVVVQQLQALKNAKKMLVFVERMTFVNFDKKTHHHRHTVMYAAHTTPCTFFRCWSASTIGTKLNHPSSTAAYFFLLMELFDPRHVFFCDAAAGTTHLWYVFANCRRDGNHGIFKKKDYSPIVLLVFFFRHEFDNEFDEGGGRRARWR
jgi:hypothetical protein